MMKIIRCAPGEAIVAGTYFPPLVDALEIVQAIGT